MSGEPRDREQYRSTCRGCSGSGETNGTRCSICRGKGYVEYKNPEKDTSDGGSKSSVIPNDDTDGFGHIRSGRIDDRYLG